MTQTLPVFPAAKSGADAMIEEDTGLFQSSVIKLQVALMPRVGENKRQDIVIAGVVSEGPEIEVLFAGRRAAASARLRVELTKAWRDAVGAARKSRRAMPDPSKVLFPVTIEGSWRATFARGEDGCETRTYQFVAARWSFIGADGIVEIAGEPVCGEGHFGLSVIPDAPAKGQTTTYLP